MRSVPGVDRRSDLGPSIVPHLWYADQPAAIAFLQDALGFALHFTAPEPGGGVHAELRIGRGFVMVGPRHTPQHAFKTPREAGDVNTGAVYIATPSVAESYERARRAGAQIVTGLHATEWASRDFTVRDHEGYLWHVGTYHPLPGCRSDARQPEVFAALRYERALGAIQWLRHAFGFDEQHVVADGDGGVAHALLRHGSSLLLLSSAREADPLRLRPPRQLGGVHTQVVYCVVEDPVAHRGRAARAGAQILVEPTVMPWGAHMYLARDPEGYVWCFSTYGPTPPAAGGDQPAAG
jgi:uncharacterized glyoxalase superfamily protein PhnB